MARPRHSDTEEPRTRRACTRCPRLPLDQNRRRYRPRPRTQPWRRQRPRHAPATRSTRQPDSTRVPGDRGSHGRAQPGRARPASRGQSARATGPQAQASRRCAPALPSAWPVGPPHARADNCPGRRRQTARHRSCRGAGLPHRQATQSAPGRAARGRPRRSRNRMRCCACPPWYERHRAQARSRPATRRAHEHRS